MLRRAVVRGRKNPAHVSFPKRLRKARLARDFGVTRLSLDAGLSDNAVSSLEQGGRVPGIDTIERLAAVLGVSLCWLAFAAGDPAGSPSAPGDKLLSAAIGERLRQARERAGLSGAALARHAEASSSTVSHIELGKFIPRLDTAEKLAKALRIAPCWLAFGIGPIDPPKRGRKPRPRADADGAAQPAER